MNHLKSEDIEISISGIRNLTQVVKSKYNFDLSYFAGTSLKRRISKIISIYNLKDIDGLIKKFHSSEEPFFESFVFHLNVEVTEFFRDPAFWRCFRKDICPVLSKNYQRIKIWIPGSSTGEEVVSCAISLIEAGIYEKSSIIASDFNNKIIKDSLHKKYSLNKLEQSENNCKRFKEDESFDLNKYILKGSSNFRFIEDIYKNIRYESFADPEKSGLKGIHMILCRNYFIYFNQQYQERLFNYFTSVLSHGGYLSIGNKENLSFCDQAAKYTLINESEKIYRKQF